MHKNLPVLCDALPPLQRRRPKPVYGTLHGEGIQPQHVRIDLRCPHVLVPQQFLDRADVHAVCQQMRGKRMPKCVASGVFLNPQFADRSAQGFLQAGGIQVVTPPGTTPRILRRSSGGKHVLPDQFAIQVRVLAGQRIATAAEITSRTSATTLLASVEPCSEPALVPATRPVGPPRCLPAWSHVQNQPSSGHAPSRATTLLASVEPCSEPALVPPRAQSGHHAARQRGAMFSTSRRPALALFGHHAARQRGAMFSTSRRPALALLGHHAARQRGAMFSTSRRPATRPVGPPRCSPAWSHVQHQPSSCHAPSRATTLLASVEPCSEPALVPPRAQSGHHAARQRGAMFRTSPRPATRPVGPPRCSPAWSHVQNQPSSSHAPSRATTLLASVEPRRA